MGSVWAQDLASELACVLENGLAQASELRTDEALATPTAQGLAPWLGTVLDGELGTVLAPAWGCAMELASAYGMAPPLDPAMVPAWDQRSGPGLALPLEPALGRGLAQASVCGMDLRMV